MDKHSLYNLGMHVGKNLKTQFVTPENLQESRPNVNSLYICVALLFLLYIFHAYNNITVLNLDSTPIMPDSTVYYRQSVKFFRALFEYESGFAKIIKDKFYSQDKPPIFAFSIIPWYLIFGVHPDVACMSNLLFLAIAIISMFLIGRYFSNDYAGLLAAFMIDTPPAFTGGVPARLKWVS